MDSEIDPRDISPDQTLLGQILPDTDIADIEVSIIHQNWHQCTLKVDLPRFSSSKSFTVRLEPADDSKLDEFRAVAFMQQLAATVIPDLVPGHLKCGNATNKDGKQLVFSVDDFAEGSTLQDVWHELDGENRGAIIAELHQALEMLHEVQISDHVAQVIAHETLSDKGWQDFQGTCYGGPDWGFHKDGPALLGAVERYFQLKKPFYEKVSSSDPNGVIFKSQYREHGSAVVRDSDMEQWADEAVLCHNALALRNIILQRPSTKEPYKLIAITNWELAGFFPPAFELAFQDTLLASANMHVPYYLALKQSMKELVPRTASQLCLARAVQLIHESQKRYLEEGRNIPATIRKRLLERLGLVRHGDPYVGWAPVEIEFSPEMAQELENSTVEEIRGTDNQAA